MNKINKNKSKERKTVGSFGSFVNKRKIKLFSFPKEQINHCSINMKNSSIVSISSKNINYNSNDKDKKFQGIKKDTKKVQTIEQKLVKRKKIIEKKISYKKIKELNKNLNKINNNNIEIKLNDNNIENNEIIKLEEEKVSKNPEMLFSSKGNNFKDESKEENKDNNSDTNYTNTKNSLRHYTSINTNSIINEKNINNNSSQQITNIKNKPFNYLQNKSKLLNNKSELSKNNFLINENKSDIKDKNFDKDKEIIFKKSMAPATIDIYLDVSNSSNNYNNQNDYNDENQYLLSSERYLSSKENVALIYSILKDNTYINKNYSFIENLNAKNNHLFFQNFNSMHNINKSRHTKREIVKNKKIKTEFNEKTFSNKNRKNDKKNNKKKIVNFSVEKNNPKEIQKKLTLKTINNINYNEDDKSLCTLDNESFKKNAIRKFIKNNQYKTLLTQMVTINNNKEKDEDNKDNEKEQKRFKKKFKFSERKRGSSYEEPYKRLTESRENYYDLYKKTFYGKSLEQKFSFKPKTKKKNYYYKYNNKYKTIENDKILNKIISTISFNSKQKEIFDTDINREDISLSNKNLLSNNLDENIFFTNEDEKDNNKNFILDLNHFIPIDEDKLFNTISSPIFNSDTISKNYKEEKKTN